MSKSEEQFEVLKKYFTQIAQRVLPIFQQYGWSYGKNKLTVKTLVDFLFELQNSVEETGKPAIGGRFMVMKVNNISDTGYQVYLDLAESDWEFNCYRNIKPMVN
jgi:hypothetical protein